MDQLRVPRMWRETPQHYRLEASRCLSCSEIYFPPRTVCNKCKSKNIENVNLPRRGTIETFTVIRIASPKYQVYVPYGVALVKLENGVKILSQLTDCETGSLKIGMPVEAVIRKLYDDGEDGVIHYGFKFRPVALPE